MKGSVSEGAGVSESDHLSQRRPAAANPRVKGSVSEGAGVSESDHLGPSERIRVSLRRPGRRRSQASPSPTTGPPLGSVRGCRRDELLKERATSLSVNFILVFMSTLQEIQSFISVMRSHLVFYFPLGGQALIRGPVRGWDIYCSGP